MNIFAARGRLAVRVCVALLAAACLTSAWAASAAEQADLIKPDELVKILQKSKGEKPLIIQVGFRTLYAQAHIPGSEYIGPGSSATGLEQLRKRVSPLSRDKFIVIYCGCCPWEHCPNVKPAAEALHALGFSNVKVLFIADNFGADWVDKGYPVVKGE